MKVYFATRMGHIVSPERSQVKRMTWKIQPTCSVIQHALGGVASLILGKWLGEGMLVSLLNFFSGMFDPFMLLYQNRRKHDGKGLNGQRIQWGKGCVCL